MKRIPNFFKIHSPKSPAALSLLVPSLGRTNMISPLLSVRKGQSIRSE